MKIAYVRSLKKEPKIKVHGRKGSYSVIDDYKGYVLLEHNTYGEDCIVVEACKFIYKEFTNKTTGEKVKLPYFDEKTPVYETYDDIKTTLEDYELI